MGFEHIEAEEEVNIAALQPYVKYMILRQKESLLTSMMVNEQGRWRSANFICALCTRPRIFAVPTPRAIPANRVSIRRMMLKCI